MLVYLTVVEIVILILTYMYLLCSAQTKNLKQAKKIKEMAREKAEKLHK